MMNPKPTLAQTSISRLGTIDAIADRFEREWRERRPVRIEAFLAEYPAELREELLAELLAIEWEYLHAAHAPLAIESYRARFPDSVSLVNSAWGAFQQKHITSNDEPTEVAAQRVCSADRPTEAMPTQIGKYVIVEVLGTGGQATVYRAKHPLLRDRDVVIKLCHERLSPEQQRQIIEEGNILEQFEHPHLIRVLDVDVHDDRPYLVFDYVEGRTLRSATLDQDQAVEMVRLLAETLSYVHRRNVIHRDLKPANVLIDEQGQPRILDFGLGHSIDVWKTQRTRNDLAGTWLYMAPEQAGEDISRIGPWTDVYGLGAILYELLTGQPHRKFPESTDWAGKLKVVECGEVAPPRSIQPRIPRSLEAITLRALAADPAQRYRSAQELASALAGYQRQRQVRRWLPAVVATLAMLLAGGGYLWYRAGSDGSDSTALVAVEPLMGELNVRIWSNAPSKKRGLPIHDPQALPVRNGEQVHVEAALNRNAYLYLVWIDSEGKITQLNEALSERRRTLHSPEKLDEGWEMIGAAGMETVVLLASDERLPEEVDFNTLLGSLPPSTPSRGFVTFEVERNATGTLVKLDGEKLSRGLGGVKQLDDPVVQALQRLRERFDLVKGIRFAHGP